MLWRTLLLWCLGIPSALALTLIDDQGQAVTLERPAQRIVSLMPHGTELLFELGAGDRLVGAVEYSDYPEAAKALPRVGSAAGLNIERIISLKPDVVLAWPDAGQRDMEKLRKLGMTLYVSNPNSYEDIARNLELLGKLVGLEANGLLQAQHFRQQVHSLRLKHQHKNKLRVFYQIWHDPLMSQNGETFISQAINLCGGINVFEDMPIQAPQVSIEAVLALNPHVIIASSVSAGRPQWLDEWQRFSSLAAVQSESLYHIAADSLQRPTSRFLQGTRQLCQVLEKTRQRPVRDA